MIKRRKSITNIIYLFVAVNLIAMLFVGIVPASATVPNLDFLFILNLVFILVVILFSLLIFSMNKKKHIERKKMSSQLLIKNIKFLSYAPVAGIALLIYDRVILRGIDYTQGLRQARYAWLDTLGGSPIGILGNLLVPFSYVGIFFLVMHYERISKKQQRYLIAGIILGVIGHAALNGGRSNLLLAIAMILIAFTLKRKNIKRVKTKTRGKIKYIIIFIFSAYYITYITLSSATMAQIDIDTLVQLGIKGLYGEMDPEFFSTEHSNGMYLLIYISSYLYHGQWTSQVAYSLLEREGTYSTPPLINMFLNNFGAGSNPEAKFFSDTGAFISLPGAFYYDYGFLGVLGLSSLFGIILGFVFIIINNSRSVGGIKTAFIVGILLIVILSPMVPAYGLSYFNFIVYSFIMTGIINMAFFKRKVSFLN